MLPCPNAFDWEFDAGASFISIEVISIKSYPARNGDAFLLKIDGTQLTAMLIDGGYGHTFQDYIREDLVALARDGYALDLVVATHIDSDHVGGLIPLFKANGIAQKPGIIPIRRVFHNSLRSLSSLQNPPAPLSPGDQQILRQIQSVGIAPGTAEMQSGEQISARQGSSLASLLKAGGYSWNEAEGTTTVSGDGSPSHPVGSARITIIGPPRARLERLRSWWSSEIRRVGFSGPLDANGELDDAFEFLCSAGQPSSVSHTISSTDISNCELQDCYLRDDSVTNGSSIAFMIEVGARRLLFLGDAWAEDAETAIRALHPGPGPTLFDAIKVSHHGSIRNTSPSLLDLVDARLFFVSSNGDGHDHPDLPVLKAIVDRPGQSRILLFNYSTAASSALRSHTSKSRTPFTILEGVTGWVDLETMLSP